MSWNIYRNELRTQIALTLPLLLAQISMVAMGFVDMVMTGAVGAVDMAAVALGGSIWIPLLFFCQGVLRALHPAIAKLRGEGKVKDTMHVLHQGILLALALSCFLIPAVYSSSFFLTYTDIDPYLVTLVGKYLDAIVWGGPGYLCFIAAQCFLEGLGYTRPSMFAGFLGLFLNVIFNYIFIFGSFGMPAFGGAGAGIATAIVYWGMLCVILFYIFMMKDIPLFFEKSIHGWFDWTLIKSLIQIGFPGGLALFFEVTMFLMIGLLVAPLGVVFVAGHQVALNFSTLAFIFPYSLSMISTIRVGYSIGKNSFDMVRVVSRVSLVLGFVISLFTAFVTLIFRYEIASLYNNDPAVLKIAKDLMLLAAMYQCVDAIQVVCMGILRGYNDTKTVFVIAFVAYWLVSLPIGYLLGMTDWFVSPMGVEGFWVAFLFGLFLAAVLGFFRMRFLEHNLYKALSA